MNKYELLMQDIVAVVRWYAEERTGTIGPDTICALGDILNATSSGPCMSIDEARAKYAKQFAQLKRCKSPTL